MWQDGDALVAAAQRAAASVPATPFTLVIEIDAGNIRERDGWGPTAELTQAGQPPSRWHWVYGAAVFRLDQRGQTAGGRPVIRERGDVMTRGGVDTLRTLLWAEAQRRGLAQAATVLVVADGAVWIWNLVTDRFGQAHQRLDYYHASQHLWTVAAALHGEGTPAARRWVEPLLEQLRGGQAAKVIRRLEQLELRVKTPVAETVRRERQYFANHRARLDYATATARGWPLGSGAMESSCRQYQCRFKRPGQFWSQQGDEALLVLQEYWRNGRWAQLFPHMGGLDPARSRTTARRSVPRKRDQHKQPEAIGRENLHRHRRGTQPQDARHHNGRSNTTRAKSRSRLYLMARPTSPTNAYAPRSTVPSHRHKLAMRKPITGGASVVVNHFGRHRPQRNTSLTSPPSAGSHPAQPKPL